MLLFCFLLIITILFLLLITILFLLLLIITIINSQLGEALFEAIHGIFCDPRTATAIQRIEKRATHSELVQGRIGDFLAVV